MIRVSAIEGHRLWAPVYDSELNPVLSLERRSMRGLLKPLRPPKVIDVACGTGKWLLHFQHGGSDVFGCDACEAMLSEAAKSVSLRGRLTLADAERIPFRNAMADLVLCSVSLGYFQNIRRVFREFARASKPGGSIVVSDLHPRALAAGWVRSFKLGESRYEMDHHRRSLEEVADAASAAGLRAKSWREIYFGAPELPIFQRTGKEAVFSSAASIPALFIGLWEKRCC